LITYLYPWRKISSLIGNQGEIIIMERVIKIIAFGFLTWLIPFLVAIPFYSPNGTILIDQSLFKSIMIITGGITGAFLVIRSFKGIWKDFIRFGCLIGVVWLLINWVLDFIILLPLNGMDISTYFSQIGIRYLMIPIMSIMAGYVAKNARLEYMDKKKTGEY
jgi:hypothetical protein